MTFWFFEALMCMNISNQQYFFMIFIGYSLLNDVRTEQAYNVSEMFSTGGQENVFVSSFL